MIRRVVTEPGQPVQTARLFRALTIGLGRKGSLRQKLYGAAHLAGPYMSTSNKQGRQSVHLVPGSDTVCAQQLEASEIDQHICMPFQTWGRARAGGTIFELTPSASQVCQTFLLRLTGARQQCLLSTRACHQAESPSHQHLACCRLHSFHMQEEPFGTGTLLYWPAVMFDRSVWQGKTGPVCRYAIRKPLKQCQIL